jgi:hypothetical protein
LLFAGIYGAWDLTLWLARNKDKTNATDAICEFALRSEG